MPRDVVEEDRRWARTQWMRDVERRGAGRQQCERRITVLLLAVGLFVTYRLLQTIADRLEREP